MLDIKTVSAKPYQFKDGPKVITTKNPSQSFYLELVSINDTDSESMVSAVDSAFKKMLKPEDQHYLNELDYDVKLLLIKDYVEYHAGQLEARFPGSYN